MKKIITVFSGFLFACIATCCSFAGFFKSDTEPMIRPDGKVILKDTQVQWEMFTAVMDGEIQGELAGNRPPGGHSTWNDRWISSIKKLGLGDVENSKKYIDYIIEKRRQMGLRELDSL